MNAILCVDDDEFVLKALSQDLKSEFIDEFLIELAQSTDDAFEIIDELEEENTKVLVIISDWQMPGIKGDEFLVKIHQRFPRIIKILLTGQINHEAIENAKLNADLKRIVSKPWDSKELITLIKEELEKINE